MLNEYCTLQSNVRMAGKSMTLTGVDGAYPAIQKQGLRALNTNAMMIPLSEVWRGEQAGDPAGSDKEVGRHRCQDCSAVTVKETVDTDCGEVLQCS
jgi:hypothetical protein